MNKLDANSNLVTINSFKIKLSQLMPCVGDWQQMVGFLIVY